MGMGMTSRWGWGGDGDSLVGMGWKRGQPGGDGVGMGIVVMGTGWGWGKQYWDGVGMGMNFFTVSFSTNDSLGGRGRIVNSLRELSLRPRTDPPGLRLSACV